MNIHEHQAKSMLARHGVTVPRGDVAFSLEDATRIAHELGPAPWVVKAQIHAGGRGKGGGVRVCKDEDAFRQAVQSILGMQLVTHQTGPEGQQVRRLLIEEGAAIARELYLSLLVDRGRQRVMVLASTEGGMDIEEVAARTPQKILRAEIDPAVGILPFQTQRVMRQLGLRGSALRAGSTLLRNFYQAFIAEDCSLLEINPLVITADDQVLALDAKINFDDNALFRHPETQALRDLDEEEALEIEADQAGLSYIKLDGQIGCMVNGAGLAMGTMDMIKAAGGEPANFLDIGGTADAARVEKAFRIITSDPHVKAILINIFGGIVRCDVVAEGVVAAFKTADLHVPVIVRLEGTNAEQAREIIAQSALAGQLTSATDLKDAALKSVAATK